MTSLKLRIVRIVSFTRVCLAAWVKEALLWNRKPILDLILDWRCLMWVWKESLKSNQTPRYLYLSTYSKSEASRVVMLDVRAGANSEQHAFSFIAFQSSCRPRKESESFLTICTFRSTFLLVNITTPFEFLCPWQNYFTTPFLFPHNFI